MTPGWQLANSHVWSYSYEATVKVPLPVSRPPDALTSLPHWVGWRYESRNGSSKPTKVPYCLATGQMASSTNPADWLPFDSIDALPEGYDGIGFVLTREAGYTGIDFDDCLTDAGTVKPWAEPVLSAFSSTYSEISPSGTGVKVWARGIIPGDKGTKVYLDAAGQRTKKDSPDVAGAIEMYCWGRYFTVTGRQWGSPDLPDCQNLVTALYRRITGEPATSTGTPTKHPPGDVIEGGRHEFLKSKGAHLRNAGLGEDALLAALRAENLSRCRPPKPDHEVIAIAKWFFRVGADPSFVPRARVNGHAAASSAAMAAPAIDATPADIPAEPTQADCVAVAEAIIAAVVESGNPAGIFSEETITALALAGEIKQHDAKRRFEKSFPKDFPGNIRHWQGLIRKAEALDRAARYVTAEGWEGRLIRKPAREDGSPGAIQLCEANAILYFENHPDWDGVLGYNEFTAQHAVLRQPPAPVKLKPGQFLEDYHDTQFARWLQVHTQQPWKVEMVRRAVDCWARDHSFHPVRDYLDTRRPWKPGDQERLKTWLFDYAGAGPSDSSEDIDQPLMDFIAAAGERWMISAVARVRDPGCEVHHMLVLEGGEGLGKSMLVKKLGRGWSQVMQGALDGRSAQELIASAVWIWEFAELASLKKTQEVESAKAFITNPEETFRPAYGRRVIRHKRECAFIATVNGDQYFDSVAWEDGKRRAWPIRCTRPFDLDGLEDVIDSLWAEADYKYHHGYRWHFDRTSDAGLITTAKAEQVARVPEHVLSSTFIRAALSICEKQVDPQLYGSASVTEILAESGVPVDRRRSLQQDVGRCLKASGWKVYQPRASVRTDVWEKGEQLRRWRNLDKYPLV